MRFVDNVNDLTENGKKILLMHDGYISHMMLCVLEMFDENSIVVYTISAHSSCYKQP